MATDDSEISSHIRLKKEADKLYFDGKWSEAEAIYLQLIQHPKHQGQVATLNSFRERISRCRIHLDRFKEAGDILLEMCHQILRYEDQLLIWIIPRYLKHAYICYWLSGETKKRDEILRYPGLTESQRQEILSQNLSAQNLLQ